jgi:hypothetical protein
VAQICSFVLLIRALSTITLTLEVYPGRDLPLTWLCLQEKIQKLARRGIVRKFLYILALVMTACLPVTAQQQPIRINCGGPTYLDSKAQTWQADHGFNAGIPYLSGAPIGGTTDPTLYTTERYNSGSSPMIYSFPVANGLYQVNLLFAESFFATAGARVFNVKLQGNPVFQNLDIFASVGADKALVKGATVTVLNGVLAIEFDNVVQNAKISAIEILPSASPTMSLQFNYPDGTPVVGVLNYSVSSSLVSFQGSQPLANGAAQCELFANPSAMGISAQFLVSLSLTDAAGHTLWQLNVGMNPAQVNLGEVQSSSLRVIVLKM